MPTKDRLARQRAKQAEQGGPAPGTGTSHRTGSVLDMPGHTTVGANTVPAIVGANPTEFQGSRHDNAVPIGQSGGQILLPWQSAIPQFMLVVKPWQPGQSLAAYEQEIHNLTQFMLSSYRNTCETLARANGYELPPDTVPGV